MGPEQCGDFEPVVVSDMDIREIKAWLLYDASLYGAHHLLRAPS
jgi:hypothetical protein